MFKNIFSNKSKLFSGCVLIFGILSSFIVVNWIRGIELDERIASFQSGSSEFANIIYRTNLVEVNNADVANFIMATPEDSLNLDTYDTFTELALSFGVGSLAYISWHPRIRAGERQSFVSSSQLEYTNLTFPYNITQLDEDGSGFVPRDITDEDIWPVLYQFPLTESLLGFDIHSDTQYRDSIDFMIEVQDNSVSSRIFSRVDGEPSIQSLQPVFRNSELVGCVSRLISIVTNVNRVLNRDYSIISTFYNIKFRVYISLGDGREQIMYDSDGFIIIEGGIEESSADFMDSGKNAFELIGSLDDKVGLHVIIVADVKIPMYFGWSTLLFLILFTFVVSFGIYKWGSLLSQRTSALDIAIAQSEHKSKFVAEMSHEFRNPLNGIIGMIDLIKSEEQSKTSMKFVSIAESCSKMMLSVVNDILDYSKIESGSMKIVRRPTSLRNLLKETVTVMRATYMKKLDVTGPFFIKLDIDSTVPGNECDIDDDRIKQIIVNLVSNALKFTKSGSVSLFAFCNNRDCIDGEMRLNVSITDTGIGMNQEGVDRLFKPFSQVHNAKTVRAGGTGLGLVICKTLCDLMDGGINCESVEGQGSTFSFSCTFGKSKYVSSTNEHFEWDLNKDISDDDTYIVDETTRSAEDPLGACFNRRSDTTKKPSVIVADDVNVNRLILERIMTPLGVDMNFVADGLQLVNMCMHNKYSIILTDVNMPLMNGAEASRVLATGSGPNKNTPILSISGSSSDGGMFGDSIVKPVSKTQLYEKFSKWLTDDEVTWIHDHFNKNK